MGQQQRGRGGSIPGRQAAQMPLPLHLHPRSMLDVAAATSNTSEEKAWLPSDGSQPPPPPRLPPISCFKQHWMGSWWGQLAQQQSLHHHSWLEHEMAAIEINFQSTSLAGDGGDSVLAVGRAWLWLVLSCLPTCQPSSLTGVSLPDLSENGV